MDTTERLTLLISDVLEADPATVGPEAGVDTLEAWDSLAQLRIAAAAEEEFGVKFTMQEIGELTSVAAILGLLRGRGGA